MSNEGFLDKVKDFVKGHPDQADSGMDRAQELVNERTGGKYADQVSKGGDMVRQHLGILGDDAARTAGQPAATETTPAPGPGPSVPEPSPGVPGDPTPTPEPGTFPPNEPDTQPSTFPVTEPGTEPPGSPTASTTPR